MIKKNKGYFKTWNKKLILKNF